MSALYKHADAREGVRELIAELGKAEDRLKFKNVSFCVHSMKWIHLIATDCESPRAAPIRQFNEFTIGYTTDVPFSDPADDNHVEVARTDDGQLCFLENGNLLAASELASKLIRMAAVGSETGLLVSERLNRVDPHSALAGYPAGKENDDGERCTNDDEG